MLTKNEKIKILENILSTKDFKTSKSYTKLLTYLVEASIKNKKLKEYYLAVDVFEKSSDFNSSEDSSVRVYVSNLRKKLDHYYATEGRDDKYKIEIPKGHYDLNFVPNKIKETKSHTSRWNKIAFVLFPISILLLLFSIFNLNKVATLEKSSVLDNPVWSNFASNKLPELIILGNDLFFLQGIGDEETIIRKHEINTIGMFSYYKKKNPDKKITRITPYSFFPLINVSVLPQVSISLLSKGKFNFKSSINVNGNDFKENNIIFLGSFRNLHSLEFLLQDGMYEYSNYIKNTYLKIKDHDSIKVFRQSGQMDKEHVDFCLFRKLPGPNNNTIYMFISFFEPAMKIAVDYMLNKQKLKELTNLMNKRYGKLPKYFDVLFRSSGFKRKAYTSKIEYIHKINPDSLNIW